MQQTLSHNLSNQRCQFCQGARELPAFLLCQGEPSQAGGAGPPAHAPCTCLLITERLNVPHVGALWFELAEYREPET